ADPRQLGGGRLGARPGRPRAEPGAARRLYEAREGVTGGPSDPRERLAALGLTLPEGPAPVASYVPAVRTGDLVPTGGQLPFVDGRLPRTGKVGADVGVDEARELARTCALNALAAVVSVAGDLSRIVRIVKVVGYVASAPGFTGQPQ